MHAIKRLISRGRCGLQVTRTIREAGQALARDVCACASPVTYVLRVFGQALRRTRGQEEAARSRSLEEHARNLCGLVAGIGPVASWELVWVAPSSGLPLPTSAFRLQGPWISADTSALRPFQRRFWNARLPTCPFLGILHPGLWPAAGPSPTNCRAGS